MFCKNPLFEGSAIRKDTVTDNQQHSQETDIQTDNQREWGVTDPSLDRTVNGIGNIRIK